MRIHWKPQRHGAGCYLGGGKATSGINRSAQCAPSAKRSVEASDAGSVLFRT